MPQEARDSTFLPFLWCFMSFYREKSPRFMRRIFLPCAILYLLGLVAQWLERFPDKKEVGGSTPPEPTTVLAR